MNNCGRFVLFSLFLLLSSRTFADSQDHQNSESATQGNESGRATKASPLTDRELKFISENFFISQLTVWNKYSEKLPKALESAMKDKNESGTSAAVAELMGMINGQQAKRVLENAVQERDKEKEKKPNGGDERYIALMERFVWGAKAFIQEPSKEESAEKYNKEFNEAFKNVSAKNQEIREKIKQAADGNDQAKDWLRKNLDQSSLLSFAEGQRKYGNKELADRLIDALSFKEGKNKFLDMKTANETQRLHLGQSSTSVSQSLDKFFENKKGFNSAVASFSPFTKPPMKEWFVDSNGNFKPGAPANFVAKETLPTGGKGSSSGATSSSSPSAQAGSSSQTSGTTPGSNASSANAAIQARNTILATCRNCHGSATFDTAGVFNKDGSARSKTDILDALNNVPEMVQKIPLAKKAKLIALINEWVK
jgi:cytochrome c553